MPSSPPLELLVPAAAAAGFVIGKIALGGGGTGTLDGATDAVPAGGAKAAGSGTAAGADPYDAFGASASIDFGEPGAPGVLNGIRPGRASFVDDGYDPYAAGGYDPYASGGLPGGGDAVAPPLPPPPSAGSGDTGFFDVVIPTAPPTPAPTPTPTPTPPPTPTPTSTWPAGATGHVSVKAGTYRIYRLGTVGGKLSIVGYSTFTTGGFSAYMNRLATYPWPAENSQRYLGQFTTSARAGQWFAPNQAGVTFTRRP